MRKIIPSFKNSEAVISWSRVIGREICVRVADQTECLPHLQGEEADDDDIYNVLSTLKRLTAFHKYAAVLLNYCANESYFCPLGVIEC